MSFPKIPGAKLYLVGGCVRDRLLGRESKDDDYVVVTDLSFQELCDAIQDNGGEIFLAKPQFFTIRAMVDGKAIDIVYPRTESGYADGRHPDAVAVASTLAEDALRRDFTINAMYMDEDGNVYDPLDGMGDLHEGVIRAKFPVRQFTDDSLRIFRAIRFSVQLAFEIEPLTFSAMSKCAPLIRGVSPERIREELNKALIIDPLMTMLLVEKLNLEEYIKAKGLHFEVSLRQVR